MTVYWFKKKVFTSIRNINYLKYQGDIIILGWLCATTNGCFPWQSYIRYVIVTSTWNLVACTWHLYCSDCSVLYSVDSVFQVSELPELDSLSRWQDITTNPVCHQAVWTQFSTTCCCPVHPM